MINVHFMTANTAGILDFLREFKRECFAGRDIFTVGEANGVSADELKYWVGEDGVFDMLFEFSHMNLALKNGETWCYPTPWKLSELKKVLSDSQLATKNNGWCPIFFENHDQPRCVNHFFENGANPVDAAKAMAAVLLTLRGTPFIYEGQELGCTNVAWSSIDAYNDISSRGQYKFALDEGFTPEQALEFVHFFSRDNARTPMQWSAQKNAGFSEGEPWLPVNENFKTVNAAAEENDSESVLAWYRKLAKFRAAHKELTAGDFELLLPDDENIFAFSRRLGGRAIFTVVNFSTKKIPLPEIFHGKKTLIGRESRDLTPLEVKILEATP